MGVKPSNQDSPQAGITAFIRADEAQLVEVVSTDPLPLGLTGDCVVIEHDQTISVQGEITKDSIARLKLNDNQCIRLSYYVDGIKVDQDCITKKYGYKDKLTVDIGFRGVDYCEQGQFWNGRCVRATNVVDVTNDVETEEFEGRAKDLGSIRVTAQRCIHHSSGLDLSEYDTHRVNGQIHGSIPNPAVQPFVCTFHGSGKSGPPGTMGCTPVNDQTVFERKWRLISRDMAPHAPEPVRLSVAADDTQEEETQYFKPTKNMIADARKTRKEVKKAARVAKSGSMEVVETVRADRPAK